MTLRIDGPTGAECFNQLVTTPHGVFLTHEEMTA